MFSESIKKDIKLITDLLSSIDVSLQMMANKHNRRTTAFVNRKTIATRLGVPTVAIDKLIFQGISSKGASGLIEGKHYCKLDPQETTAQSFCMIPMKSFNPLGAILNMSNEAVNRLRRMISQGSEVERKLSAGVFRSIISDMITLYEENRKYRGKGILVFNPSEPTASKYCTIQDLEADLSIAQEAMSSDMEEMFHKVIKFVEKESNSGLALVAFYEEDHLELMRLDPEHANEVIDSATNGLIL